MGKASWIKAQRTKGAARRATEVGLFPMTVILKKFGIRIMGGQRGRGPVKPRLRPLGHRHFTDAAPGVSESRAQFA
jgi:hypothetical protein